MLLINEYRGKNMNDNNMFILLILSCTILFIVFCYNLMKGISSARAYRQDFRDREDKLVKEQQKLKKELELYKGRCEFISGIAIDYDGARTVKSLKETIDDMKDVANGKADDTIKDMIDQMSEGNNNDEF